MSAITNGTRSEARIHVDLIARIWGIDPLNTIDSAWSGLSAAHWRFDHDGANGGDTGINETALEVGISPRYLLTMFRHTTGRSPHRWLTERRLARASDMSRDVRCSNTEIANTCGFASAQRFATASRAIIGMSPSEYRAQCAT